ncbi:hypothetical protein G6F63_014615 [Rhizopus arrhizus]|nr:hypothetical protein G6F63_014615 [Rhizopus arrhizus]
MPAPGHHAEGVGHQPFGTQAGTAGAHIQWPDDEVDLAPFHTFNQGLEQALDQFDLHVGRTLVQRGNGARQQDRRGGKNGSDMQMAGHAPLDRVDFLASARGGAQDATRVAPERTPGLCQFKRPATQEQRRADFAFQLLDLLAERRLADAKPGRGLGQMGFLGHGQEVAQKTQIN